MLCLTSPLALTRIIAGEWHHVACTESPLAMSEIVAVPGRSDAWRVGDTEFVRSFGVGSTPERFRIRKNASLIALYQELCPRIRGSRIVELGIADGGSTALLALAAQPSKLVALELDAEPRSALDSFVDSHQLGDVVRPHYGLDQGDRERLARIVDKEFAGEPIDVVIDDASHQYAPTLASFEVLFPRLRPGGLIIIEDWGADYFYAEAIARKLADTREPDAADLAERLGGAKYRQDTGREPKPQPLPRLAQQLVLACLASPQSITSVSVDHHWLTARRGSTWLDPASFSVADLYVDHFGWLDI
jgi:predicted O-methyltransferase YrrM